MVVLPILVIWGLIASWLRFIHMTPHDWSVLGDIVRNTSGLIALASALLTIRVMHKTNTARAKEATSSEFRDQMQWAADSLASNDPIKMAYAQMLIQRYAEDKPKLLNERDHQLVLEMWALSQALFGEKDVDNLEEKTEEGKNEGT
ncbi:hypothetical protein A7979_07275 [Rothia nasimurium]|uniref:Uncharacterized protein n=2 Tax=Micrococcaceae TaxID=1268 RepID=A0A1Y1RM58_9MICC|nr:hypothetical protein A7979_07275 [Rothia nasimurium]